MSRISDEFPFNRPAPAPLQPAPRDRRRTPRQTLVAKATLRSTATPVGSSSVFVSNISMLGVGFHTRAPLPLGDRYQIKLEVGPMQWASLVRVVMCTANTDGTYDIGAEFIGNQLATHTRSALAA